MADGWVRSFDRFRFLVFEGLSRVCLSWFSEEFFDCRGGLYVDGVFLGIGVNGPFK